MKWTTQDPVETKHYICVIVGYNKPKILKWIVTGTGHGYWRDPVDDKIFYGTIAYCMDPNDIPMPECW